MHRAARRITLALLGLALCAGAAAEPAPAPPAGPPPGWTALFNGKDLTGWELRDPKGKNTWSAADGVLHNDPDGTDLQTADKTFQDFEMHAEFKVIVWSDEEIVKRGGAKPDPHVSEEVSAKTGNSGIYLRGKYEIQIYDSFGRFPGWRECGALYKRVPPRVNACKPAGEWQSFDITFVGKSLEVKQNGMEILNVNNVGPKGTGSREVFTDAPGPILFQGDHGAVEFRNVWVKRL